MKTVTKRGLGSVTLSVTLVLAACAGTDDETAEETATSPADTASGQTDGTTASPCSFPLVELQTGPDKSCGGGNKHKWPVGMASTDCHGWQAVDTKGKKHDNSAAAIKCLADGSFTFTQYAGNLACSGTGVVKTYKAGVCQQDIPPKLYTVAVDLTCCSDPKAATCKKGLPSVTIPGAAIFHNGKKCP